MPYDVMSMDELTDLVVASYASLLPDKNVGRNSDNWKRLRVLAGAVADLHAHIDAVWRDSMPDTATGESLDRWAAVVGLERRAATAASADNAGKVRGTNGSTWTTSDVLVAKSGLTFRPTAGGTMGVTGEALIGVIGISTGPSTRLTSGEVLTWQSTPSGLEDEVELQADLASGGDAAELDGSLVVRVVNRLAQKALGGSANDWEQWALESSPAIATAYVYPNRNGLGSVDIAALKSGSGSARLLDSTERADLLTYLNGLRPVTAAVRVLEVITQSQDVEVKVTPESDPRLARDWDDTTAPVVASWNAATRTLTFVGTRPASMQVGSRLTVANTAGVEMAVESLVSTNAVVLANAMGQTPASPNNVYSGGPLVTPARNAIIALFDSLGPRVGSFGFGNWDSTLRTSTLFETVQTTVGVLDSSFVTPTLNISPADDAYPDDAQVRVLVPGNILVRYL